MREAALPDFFVVGAPKAGTTALHAALAAHPDLYASPVKEPKYFMADGQPPARSQHRGPGDAHSAREWVWQPERYRELFAAAPPGALRFESTPFYLWHRESHRRIAQAVPHAKLIAVIRDPVDRAFSNWTHLRADGLEPEPDFLRACRAEPARVARGWAPFWRYLELGRYGEQLEHLFEHIDPSRVLVIRYRALVDTPQPTLEQVCRFLGVRTGQVAALPDSNVGRWAGDGPVNTLLRWTIRGGARAGALTRPELWRRAEKRLLAALQRGQLPRPQLDPGTRAELVGHFAEDNQLLSRLLGTDYSDWLSTESRGTYTVRKACEPSSTVASK